MARTSHEARSPRRIVVKAVNWLGDLVMSLPALRAVREGFPSAYLGVMVRRELAGFFDGIRWVDEVIAYETVRGLRAWPRHRQIVRELRRREFELALLLPNSFESALWMALARIPQRIGYATDGRGLLLTGRLRPAPDALNGHQSRYWLGLVRDGLGVAEAETAGSARLTANGADVSRIRSWLEGRRTRRGRPLVALAPAAAYGPAKEWPAERFTELIDTLARRAEAECVLIGTAAERDRCAAIAGAAAARPIVAAGEISLRELIALLSLCDGFVGNDSGAMHVAAALGIATVAVFGSTNPRRTGPRGPRVSVIQHPPPCSPCLQRHCRFGHYDCLKAVTVSEVAEELARLRALDPTAHERR